MPHKWTERNKGISSEMGEESERLPVSWGHSTALLLDRNNILKTHHTGRWMCQALLQKQNPVHGHSR